MEAPTWGMWQVDSQTILSFLKSLVLYYVMMCAGLYVFVMLRIVTPSNKTIPRGSKILIVTAHPDDECLFFAPAVTEMVHSNSVHILCVTSGDYYSEGATRKKEILESCQVLGVPKQNVDIFDDRSFPDGHNTAWDMDKLQGHLSAYIERLQPDSILTFDEHGVSGHPNHIAVLQVLRQIFEQKGSSQSSIKLYKLETVPLVRKYISFLDLPMTLMAGHLTFVSTFSSILCSLRAMFAHRTQLIWYRVLYVMFSRYMIMNTFVPVESL